MLVFWAAGVGESSQKFQHCEMGDDAPALIASPLDFVFGFGVGEGCFLLFRGV